MSIDVVPLWMKVAGVGVVIALAAGAFVSQQMRISSLQVDLANEKAGRSGDREAYATAAVAKSTENQAETARVVVAQSEIANEAQRFANRARADAVVLAASGDRLRSATAATAARCGAVAPDPAVAAVSPAASSPGDLLADVQGRLSQAAESIGNYADDLRPAAEQCAGSYDALTPSSISLPRMKLGR